MATRSDARPSSPEGLPELELDVRPAPKPKAKPKRQTEPDGALELAVDLRALVQERSHTASPAAAPFDRSLEPAAAEPAPLQTPDAGPFDVAADARLLANYGDPPRHWILTPLYALRVLKTRHSVSAALIGRCLEAATAGEQLDTAIVAFALQVRATAETVATYARALEELQRAEEALKTREGVFAEERHAHDARLSLVDQRLAALETEAAQAEAQGSPDAKTRDSDAEYRVKVARSQRASLEHWLKRQGESRATAAKEASEHVWRLSLALGRRAISDRGVFGVEFDPSRAQIARLQAAQQSAARDVTVHDAALGAHDARSLRQGLGIAAVLVLVVVVAPIIWRATRVVEPPTTHVLTGP